MTLTELQAEVYKLTNRPDLVAQTLAAVRAATLKAHRIDYFYRDLFETGLTFTPADYIQQVDYKTLYPRFRALSYLRKFDPTVLPAPGLAGKFFTVVTPTGVLDNYEITKEDVCYIAGAYLQIRSSTSLTNALIGFYQDPLTGITDGTFTSWVAVDHPWAIIFEASRAVSKMIGKDQAAKGFESQVGDEYALLKTTNILAEGY
jgi:hypothetical protein